LSRIWVARVHDIAIRVVRCLANARHHARFARPVIVMTVLGLGLGVALGGLANWGEWVTGPSPVVRVLPALVLCKRLPFGRPSPAPIAPI
jgi:hypothetical protein